jgi:hypothetical protein
MQSDLQHFSSTIQRLHDHIRATPQSDSIALTRTLQSSQIIFTALDTAYNHLLALRTTLRAPSPSHPLSPLQSPPPSTSTPPLPAFFAYTRPLSSPTSHPLRSTPAANGNGPQDAISPPTAETSPAEERAAHYVSLSSPNWSTSSPLSVHYNPRRRQAADGEQMSSEEDVQRQSEDAPWYSIPPALSNDRPPPTLSPRFNLGWTPRARLPPFQLDPTTTQQAPSSVVQFTRQTQSSVPTSSSTSPGSASNPFTSLIDPNNDRNSTSGGDGGSPGNDDITSVNRAANRLYQRLSNLQETTRRLREARERRWSNLPPDRGLADGQTLTSADPDPFDPTAPARRPEVYANILRRRVLSTALPPNVGANAGGEEENKENIQGELVLFASREVGFD